MTRLVDLLPQRTRRSMDLLACFRQPDSNSHDFEDVQALVPVR